MLRNPLLWITAPAGASSSFTLLQGEVQLITAVSSPKWVPSHFVRHDVPNKNRATKKNAPGSPERREITFTRNQPRSLYQPPAFHLARRLQSILLPRLHHKAGENTATGNRRR